MSQLSREQHRLRLHLSEAERITLQEAVHHHPHPDGRERCAALLKIAQGSSPHWVARHGLLMRRDPDRVYQWLRYSQQGGIAALLGRRHGGAHRRRLRPRGTAARAPGRSSASARGGRLRATGSPSAQSLELAAQRSDL